MKIWKPDTCECVVEEIYNGHEIVGGGKIIKKCLPHEEVPDEELYGILYSNPDGENKRKNLLRKHLTENYEGTLSERKTDPNGTEVIDFKPDVTFDYEWLGSGKKRVLKLKLDNKRVVKTDMIGAAQGTLVDIEEQIRTDIAQLFGDIVIF